MEIHVHFFYFNLFFFQIFNYDFICTYFSHIAAANTNCVGTLASQIRSRIEYLLPCGNMLVLPLHSYLMENKKLCYIHIDGFCTTF